MSRMPGKIFFALMNPQALMPMHLSLLRRRADVALGRIGVVVGRLSRDRAVWPRLVGELRPIATLSIRLERGLCIPLAVDAPLDLHWLRCQAPDIVIRHAEGTRNDEVATPSREPRTLADAR